MSEEEELNFTRKGIAKIYEKMVKGELTDDDMHKAAANTEAILRDGGVVDLKVRYMGSYKPKPDEKKKEQAVLEFFKEDRKE